MRISITSISKLGLRALWLIITKGISSPSSPPCSKQAKDTSYSTPSIGLTTMRKSSSGELKGVISTLEVVLESLQITTYLSSKLIDAFTQNRSSNSS